MITQHILNFFARLFAGFFDRLPDLSPDVLDTIASLPTMTNTALGYVSRLSPVLPIQDIDIAVRIVVGGAIVAFSIKVIRSLMSYATGGGGAS